MGVTFVTEDQNVDPNTGALVEVYALTYTPADHPGAFTINASKTDDAVSEAQAAIDKLNATLDRLYAIQ